MTAEKKHEKIELKVLVLRREINSLFKSNASIPFKCFYLESGADDFAFFYVNDI